MVSSYNQVYIYTGVMMCMNMVQNFSSSFDEEFTVHIPSRNKTVQTPIENVFPLGECLSA